MASFLSPDELNYFQTGIRRLQQNYNLNNAQNIYNQKTLASEYSNNRSNLIDQFAQLRNQIPGQFIQRGLINSGLYAQGIGDYANQRARALGTGALQYQNQLGGLRIGQHQLGLTENYGINALKAQRAARISTLAASLGG